MERKDFKILWVDPDHNTKDNDTGKDIFETFTLGLTYNFSYLATEDFEEIILELKGKHCLVIHVFSMQRHLRRLLLIKRLKDETGCIVIGLGTKHLLNVLAFDDKKLFDGFLFTTFLEEGESLLEEIFKVTNAAGK